MARLLANVPLLKAGLPPLTIPVEERRAYIQTLADYETKVGQLTSDSGVWPDDSRLTEFSQFSATCYGSVRELVKVAFELQERRS
jgi:Fic family protein